MKRTPKTAPKSASRWWNFTADDGSFEARDPDRISRLYFPLCNDAGLLSAITPVGQGDIKTGQNHFLTLPQSVEDLHNTRSGRNFWIYSENHGAWSAVGQSAGQNAQRSMGPARSTESCRLQAGPLWHQTTRSHKRLGLTAEVTNFVPAAAERVEIMRVEVTNTGRQPITITPTAAIPIFGRSADNLRDHRHVTSLLHRIDRNDYGVVVTPTMSFDERGHHPNATTYAVVGCDGEGHAPLGSFPTAASFIGEGGTFDSPRAVLEDWDVPELTDVQRQGREAVGAIRFKSRKLAPGKSAVYLVFMGIVKDRKEIQSWIRTYGSVEKTAEALAHTKQSWAERLDAIQIHTDDADYGRWVRWITIQPILRKIFGCSFLPDFDYGRGGRGWRDLWQDCLGLTLLDESTSAPRSESAPSSDVRSLLLNNFAGVRMNGTNATIIGQNPGEFIADRNNISRTWMDHGVWPWMTTEFYIHQTGDRKFLFEEIGYFWDRDQHASSAPKGTVLEHILVQHLTSYFNVGEHGNIRLEDADWNDGLDMAHERGESVAFTSVYAGNLIRLADMLDHLRLERVAAGADVAEELGLLMESQAVSVDLAPSARQERLKNYRSRTAAGVSGRKITIALETLANDLRRKGDALAEHVRRQEWVKSASGHAWFNGYYDNLSKRVEGDHEGTVRMTLTGQVFPIMSGVATNEQVQQAFAATQKYLLDKKLGGFRLNTDFKNAPVPLGRAFAFAYGEKENGAFFSHMVVMFANALYRRGFVEEGHQALSSLYRMTMNTDVARIYPGLPEYFNGEGRGLYHYLTGSASWYLLTLVTQVAGVQGQWGNLLLAPKLMPDQFGASGQVAIDCGFAGKRLKITYINPSKKSYGHYKITSLLMQGRSIPVPGDAAEIVISREQLRQVASKQIEITVGLG